MQLWVAERVLEVEAQLEVVGFVFALVGDLRLGGGLRGCAGRLGRVWLG